MAGGEIEHVHDRAADVVGRLECEPIELNYRCSTGVDRISYTFDLVPPSFICFSVVSFALAGLSAGCASSEAEHVDNVHSVTPGVLIRGAQCNERGLRELRDRFGVRTVVDLGAVTFGSEKGRAERLGLNYLALPDNAFWEGDDRRVHLAFLKVVRDARRDGDAPVYVHCSTGDDRAGLAVAVYRIVECGWDADRALAELHQYQTWFFRVVLFRYPAILRNVERDRSRWLAELEKMPSPPVRRVQKQGKGSTTTTTTTLTAGGPKK